MVYNLIFEEISVLKFEIFSSVLTALELRVFVIAYSGHSTCRAIKAYDSKSESGLAAFNVITHEVEDGISLASSKNRLATRPANCDFPLPGFPEMYKKLSSFLLASFNSFSCFVISITSRLRPVTSCEGLGGRMQKGEISFSS